MTTIIQVIKTVPVTVESQLRGLVTEIGGTPADHVTQDPRKLWEWGVQLATLMISLNTDLIHAERLYHRMVKMMREKPTIKTKADADILANDTDEWENYRRLSDLMKNAREMLMVVKKFQQQFMEEKQFAREMN